MKLYGFHKKAPDISHIKSIFWPSFRTDSILSQMAMSTSSERSQWNKQTRFLNKNRCGFTLTHDATWMKTEGESSCLCFVPKQSTPRFWMMDENTAINTPRQNSSRAEGTTKLTRRFPSASNLTHTCNMLTNNTKIDMKWGYGK